MLFNDLFDILRLDLAVPDAVGIDKDGDAYRAKSDRAAVRQDDLAHRISALGFLSLADALFLQNAFELGLDLGRADLRTRLTVADKNVPPDGSFHDRCQFFEPFAVVDYLFLCHF